MVNLQEILRQYREGERGLPNYEEVRQVADRLAELEAENAQLRKYYRTVEAALV